MSDKCKSGTSSEASSLMRYPNLEMEIKKALNLNIEQESTPNSASDEDDSQSAASWYEEDSYKEPEFDLSQNTVTHIRTLDFESLQISNQLLIPQSVTRDPYFFRTYISDIGSNQIHMFEDWNYTGVLDTKIVFNNPSYILALPNYHNVVRARRYGLDLVVVDNNGIHMLDGNGLWKKTLKKGEGKSYRGLAYDSVRCTLVAIKKAKNDPLAQICLINIHDPHEDSDFFGDETIQLAKERTATSEFEILDIKPKSYSPQKLAAMDPRFVAVRGLNVYTSDIRLACYYFTSFNTLETKVVRMPSDDVLVTGIAVDPAGNILVATKGRLSSQINVFSPENSPVKKLNLGLELMSITNITLSGWHLYVTDVEGKKVHVYHVADFKEDGSPLEILVPITNLV